MQELPVLLIFNRKHLNMFGSGGLFFIKKGEMLNAARASRLETPPLRNNDTPAEATNLPQGDIHAKLLFI